jgi:peptidyl-tRNA hydrolase, PTH1 family
MKLIIGLGNPGEKYKNTRHNIGWQIVDFLIPEKEKWHESKKAKCLYTKKVIEEQEIEVIKPLTFMNNSGEAVIHILKKHGLKAENIIVIHDDLDLPLGKIRIKTEGSSGGHNGIQSIIDHLKTQNFTRIKIGIANEKRNAIPAEKFVLENFNAEEKEILEKIKNKTIKIITDLLNKKEVKEETFSV